MPRKAHYNVVIEGDTSGRYCLVKNVYSMAMAERWARHYHEKYGKNFIAIRVS